MEYFSMLAEGFTAAFDWLDMIKIGNISLSAVCLICLFFSLLWRYVLSPIFGGISDYSEKVKKDNQKKNNTKKKGK